AEVVGDVDGRHPTTGDSGLDEVASVQCRSYERIGSRHVHGGVVSLMRGTRAVTVGGGSAAEGGRARGRYSRGGRHSRRRVPDTGCRTDTIAEKPVQEPAPRPVACTPRRRCAGPCVLRGVEHTPAHGRGQNPTTGDGRGRWTRDAAQDNGGVAWA